MPDQTDTTPSEPLIGHDQLFKQLLIACFPEFLRQFDPETAGALDLSRLTFRDTEAFTDLPHGEHRLLDVVTQAPTIEGQDEIILVHVEAQREKVPAFPKRMWRYHNALDLRDNLPVIPIAILGYAEGTGIDIATYEHVVLGRLVVTFRYLRISLPRLDAVEYVRTGNVLGAALAAAMHLPGARREQIALQLAARRRVHQAREAGELDDARAFLLANFVRTYLPLSDSERVDLGVQSEAEDMAMMEATELTWGDKVYMERIETAHEKGVEEGLEKGLEAGLEAGLEQGREGQRAMLRHVLLRRFGEIPEALVARIAAAGEAELAAWLDLALSANGAEELLRQ
jgi:hypothetical protein